ncbi:MAG TPA: tetratricopeptide repeat protein, partial [Thermoanaerobaculia bacterium]|nr:tetratricopeptide repeat protein [Thermoanaerobaculia bacterium]
EPLVVAVRLSSAGPAEVSGKRGEAWWAASFTEPVEAQGAGIAKLWARQKVQSLEDSLADGADAQQVRRTVTELGLRYGLVTGHTSLVAVDEGQAIELATVSHAAAPKARAVKERATFSAESPLLDERRLSSGATVSQTELEEDPAAQSSAAVWSADGAVITDLSALGSSPAYYEFESLAELAPERMARLCHRVADPGKARSHRARAEALAKAGNLAEAEAEYIRALAYDPTNQKTWRGLEALGRRAGFTVNREALGPPCADAAAAPAFVLTERFIRDVVIVRQEN